MNLNQLSEFLSVSYTSAINLCKKCVFCLSGNYHLTPSTANNATDTQGTIGTEKNEKRL